MRRKKPTNGLKILFAINILPYPFAIMKIRNVAQIEKIMLYLSDILEQCGMFDRKNAPKFGGSTCGQNL